MIPGYPLIVVLMRDAIRPGVVSASPRDATP
jgi:hypothetical protein